jgi:MFS family permease
MDRTGRVRRLVLALIVGAAVAAVAFFVCDSLAKPDEQVRDGVYTMQHVSNAYRFVWYFTGFAFAGSFVITLAIANRLARNKWQRERVATARVV